MNSWDQRGQIDHHASRYGATEHEAEQEREHQRHEGHIGELLRVPPHLEECSPGKRRGLDEMSRIGTDARMVRSAGRRDARAGFVMAVMLCSFPVRSQR